MNSESGKWHNYTHGAHTSVLVSTSPWGHSGQLRGFLSPDTPPRCHPRAITGQPSACKCLQLVFVFLQKVMRNSEEVDVGKPSASAEEAAALRLHPRR